MILALDSGGISTRIWKGRTKVYRKLGTTVAIRDDLAQTKV